VNGNLLLHKSKASQQKVVALFRICGRTAEGKLVWACLKTRYTRGIPYTVYPKMCNIIKWKYDEI
jgi:hypothetical protein